MSRKRKNPFTYDPDALQPDFLHTGGRKRGQRKGNTDWSAPVAFFKNVAILFAVVLSIGLLSPKVFANPFKKVQISDGYGEYTLITKANSMGEIYQSGALGMKSGDAGGVASYALVTDGMEVAVDRGITVTIQSQGMSQSIRMPKGTVRQALETAAVPFDEQDEVSPSLETTLKNGDVVSLAAIDTSTVTKKAAIAFKTVEVADGSLPSGSRRVVSNGQNGAKNIQYKIKYRDGVEIARNVAGETLLSKPVDRVVAVGTGSGTANNNTTTTTKPETGNSGGSAIVVSPIQGLDASQIQEVKTMSATGYDPVSAGTSTASGTTAKRGTVAVYTPEIPLGTRLYIEDYGYGVAEDTGGAIGPGKIDLYFMSHAEALQWGRRTVKVYILK